MDRSNELYREWFFTIRGYFHDLYKSEDGKAKAAYPPSYDGVRKFTHFIQEDHLNKKTAAAVKRVSFLEPLVCLTTSFNLRRQRLLESECPR